MGTPTDLVNRREAARMMHVHPRTIDNFIQQGLLKQVFRGRYGLFARTDVVALATLFNAKQDLASVANLALRAVIKAEAAEKRVRQMAELFGLDTTPIETDEESVLSLYEQVKKGLEKDAPVNPVTVMTLAKKFQAISEEYLQLVENYTCDDEPWRPFMDYARYLCEHVPHSYLDADPELKAAYGYIEAARRSLRSVSYFYVHMRHGKEEANRIFLGGHFTDDLIRVMYPH